MSFGYQVLGFGAFPNRVTPSATSTLVVAGTNVSGGGSSHTFSSAALGTSTADRVIVLLTQLNANAAGISGCTATVAGNDMNVIVEQISVGGSTEQMVGIQAYALGADSGSTSGTLSIPDGGFACGVSRFGSSRSATWSEPFTERHDASHTGQYYASVADATGLFESATVSVTPSGSANPSFFCAASFALVQEKT